MKEKIAEEKRERYLDNILGEAEHMDAMVTEMLDLSRILCYNTNARFVTRIVFGAI